MTTLQQIQSRINDTTVKFIEDTPTLHQLLAVALEDLRRVEKNDDEMVNMGVWVEIFPGEADSSVCCTCLAGATMVHRLQAEAYSFRVPSDYLLYSLGGLVDDRLRALNDLRMGDVLTAWHRFYGNYKNYPFPQNNYAVECYSIDRKKFFHDMHRLKRRLKAAEGRLSKQ